MADQTIIQIRVDTALKEQVAQIYDDIGIDIPTAVRMFFKATVKEGSLPLNTKVSRDPSFGDDVTKYIKERTVYEAPLASDENTVVMLPLENGHTIPARMYVQLIEAVPEGKVTCWEDIAAFLGKLFKKEVQPYPTPQLPYCNENGELIRYWRLVTNRGVLGEGMGISRELQRLKLMEEGIPVSQRGSIEGSYKIDNYKEYMFDYRKLKIVVSAE